ncbi:MAG: hypothetical protein ABUJ92_14340 [Desulfobacterales bacterium]
MEEETKKLVDNARDSVLWAKTKIDEALQHLLNAESRLDDLKELGD